MAMPEVVQFLQRYAELSDAPVVTGTRVTQVRQAERGYEVSTSQGPWRCRMLVIASGACNSAAIPSLSADLPREITSLTPVQYRNPGLLPDGGVIIVGASASGIQLAREIHASGRRVVLSVGEHVRVPRTYRGRDILWWMDAIGAMDVRYDAVDDIGRARRLPSLQVVGTPERETVDLNSLRKAGVELVGRLVGLRDGKAQFSGSLANHCALADLKMNRLLAGIDDWVSAHEFAERFPAPHRFEPTDVGTDTRLGMDLHDSGIMTVIWATGYRADYSWLDVPVLDRKGRIRHDGGVVAAPGMYVLGLPFMRRRKSSFIDGAGDDAADLAAHLGQTLARAAA
jgi:putative flavoprotein involved in K+ transport